ncbi:MAG: hypothetical protein FVQ80_01355 [Planctomycetes bacterium]|nr:hypothetical protein [Planctomycetota bacterium]
MSQIDADEKMLSETAEGASEEKLVPVSESIRYRKRAQAAEKSNETLTEQLAKVQEQITEMKEQFGDIENEQKLTHKLVASGVVDLEAALLLAKTRMKGASDVDFDDVIENLRQEKQYLFDGAKSSGRINAASKRTAGVKDGIQGSESALERLGKKAATSGNRTDLHEYLKLRRNFV